MNPVTRLERWIEPRAAKILGVFSILVILGAGIMLLIRQHDIERIDRIERIVSCQDRLGCRTFIRRAIHDVLAHRHQSEGNPSELGSSPTEPKGTAGNLGQPTSPQPPSGGDNGPPKGTPGGTTEPPKSGGPPSQPEPEPTPTPRPPASEPAPEAANPGALSPVLETVCGIADHLAHLC